jgi:hypothetical protein
MSFSIFSSTQHSTDEKRPLLTKKNPLVRLHSAITLANLRKFDSGLMPAILPDTPIVVTEQEAGIIGTLSEEEGRVYREYLMVSQYLTSICNLDSTAWSEDESLKNIPFDKKINELSKDGKHQWEEFLAKRLEIESDDVKKTILNYDCQDFLKSRHRQSCRPQ